MPAETPVRAGDLVRLLGDSPLPIAIVSDEGLVAASGRFRELGGFPQSADGTAVPDWLANAPVTTTWESVSASSGVIEVWAMGVGSTRLVLIRDRAEVSDMEGRLWAQQTALARVYAELKVNEHALGRTVAALQLRSEAGARALSLKPRPRGARGRAARSDRTKQRAEAVSVPEIANLVLTGDAPALQTRKSDVTVVFADIPTFEELSNELESEELIDVLCLSPRDDQRAFRARRNIGQVRILETVRVNTLETMVT